MNLSKMITVSAFVASSLLINGCSKDVTDSILSPTGPQITEANISNGSQYTRFSVDTLKSENGNGTTSPLFFTSDIGIGRDGTRWATSSSAEVLRWDGLLRTWTNTKTESASARGTRVAVKLGQPVVVQSDGRIFQRSSAKVWSELSGGGRAVDVACNDNSVFVIGTDNAGNGNHRVYKYTGTSWAILPANVVGVRLDVAKEGDEDLVVSRADGSVYYYKKYLDNYAVSYRVGPTSGPNIVAKDVAIGLSMSSYNYYCIWATGSYGSTSNAIFANTYPANLADIQWTQISAGPGLAASIAVNGYGYPCFAGTRSGAIPNQSMTYPVIAQLFPTPKMVRFTPAEIGSSVSMGETEVTAGDYWALMGVNPGGYTETNYYGYPIRNITYFDALLYITRLNRAIGIYSTYGNVIKNNITFSGIHATAMRNITYNAGGSFRLPNAYCWTACYNGSKYSWEAPPYYWGTTPSLTYAMYGMSYPSESANSTNRWRTPTSQGLYEMSGNVAEMCDDGYNGTSGVTARGGAYNSAGADVKGTSFFGVAPATTYANVGLRLFQMQ